MNDIIEFVENIHFCRLKRNIAGCPVQVNIETYASYIQYEDDIRG